MQHDNVALNYTNILRTRAANVRYLMTEHTPVVLAQKLGLKNAAYLRQITSAEPIKTLSEKNARRWEMILGLSNGWFDVAR